MVRSLLLLPSLYDIFMITYHSEHYKDLNQNLYLKETAYLLSSIPCPVCGLLTFIFYGYYQRKIFVPGSCEFVMFNVHRLMCKTCKQTHALLPEDILVRSPINLYHAVRIFTMDNNETENFLIDNPCFSERRLNTLTSRISSWIKTNHIDLLASTVSSLISLHMQFDLYQHFKDRYFLFRMTQSS